MSRDLSEEDFLYWRGDHRVTRAAPYLMRPAVRALVTCGSGSGSVLAPLFEFPAGDGRLIVCQMLVIEKFATEPAAAKLLRAVLTYASGRVAPRPAVRVVGDRPGPVISVLDAAGVAYILRDTAPSPRALYLIDGRSAAAHQLNRRGDVLGGLLSGGATALVVEPDEETLDLLNGQLAGQTTLTLVQPSIRHQQLEFADDEEPLTAGIARRTLFWEHETQERAPAQPIARRMLEVEGRATILVREPEWTAPWANAWGGDAMQHMVTTHQRIEQPGAALVEIPVGRGRLVVSTISMSPQEEHSVRFYAQLLFNLGAGFRR